MTKAHKIYIRTTKEDSVFIYHVLEANEGIAAYSTLPFQKHDSYRDLELIVPEAMQAELQDLLDSLSDIVTVLPSAPSLG